MCFSFLIFCLISLPTSSSAFSFPFNSENHWPREKQKSTHPLLLRQPLPEVCALPPLPFFFFFSLPSLPLFLASCSRFLGIWLLASPPLRGGLDDDDDDDDTAKGLRLFPLFLERWGCSFDWDADEEEISNGSSSRERGPPANWNSSDVVEGVRYEGRQRNITRGLCWHSPIFWKHFVYKHKIVPISQKVFFPIRMLSELLGFLWSTVFHR